MTVEDTNEFRQHERYMSRCLELAGKGAGYVSPNPMVGSVLVLDGQIIGEGYHERYGGPHAEVNAIASVKDSEQLRESTLYVNLEPCSHHGKTPPCSDLIIQKNIPRVVVACRDPHRMVAGRGIQKLLDAGVEVIEGVLEERSLKLNEAFMKSHVKNMPFVSLKLGQTLDGKIATVNGLSKWITGQPARDHVHFLRSRYDAVMTGSGTIVADDPLLTVRHLPGRNPLRVVLDRRLRLPETMNVYNGEAATIVFTSDAGETTGRRERLQDKGVEVVSVTERNGRLDLDEVLRVLHANGVLSVFVEAGSRLSGSLLQSGLVDKIYLYVAPKIFGGDGLDSFAPLGVDSPQGAISLRFESPVFFGNDILLESYVLRQL